MKEHELRSPEGARRPRKRVGRGTASGSGKTSGRGTKGQKSRSGGAKAPYFEGGQLPLVRRMPFKRGFVNIFKVPYSVVNVADLGRFAPGTKVTPELLAATGLIKSLKAPVKVLGEGALERALEVHAHSFSGSAQAKIEAAGGSAVLVEEMKE
ncbi:MAG TPA: 50S ribosomal protein L15 [Anaerolineae bacterium]|nr:50S ribosomal protein L15 [Anaerolineae bacterium]HOR00962.1 50S ribosomal protein L15 [Anaerolineae bacterium]HPL28716.1 50S ribosomal protein L15 [Anaerolineae bacterium]